MTPLTSDPETRHSLLSRLRNSRDEQAWIEFSQLYEPVIYRIAARRGMQDADAREIVQEVLLSVSKQIANFDLSAAGTFRGWLSRIARNATVDHFRQRERKNFDKVGSLSQALDLEDLNQTLASEFDQQHRHQVFLWAASEVRRKVGERQWIAFWSTAVSGKTVQEVAVDLKMSEGAVYVARCRILKRIREMVRLRESE